MRLKQGGGRNVRVCACAYSSLLRTPLTPNEKELAATLTLAPTLTLNLTLTLTLTQILILSIPLPLPLPLTLTLTLTLNSNQELAAKKLAECEATLDSLGTVTVLGPNPNPNPDPNPNTNPNPSPNPNPNLNPNPNPSPSPNPNQGGTELPEVLKELLGGSGVIDDAALAYGRAAREAQERPLSPRSLAYLSHMVTASTTYGCSLHCIRPQPPSHAIAASITCGRRRACVRSRSGALCIRRRHDSVLRWKRRPRRARCRQLRPPRRCPSRRRCKPKAYA